MSNAPKPVRHKDTDSVTDKAKPVLEPIHHQFKRDIELALAQVAMKYCVYVHGVGVAAKPDQTLVVAARFGGGRIKLKNSNDNPN